MTSAPRRDGLVGDRDAHAAAGAVADVADGVQGLAGAARGHEDSHAGQAPVRLQTGEDRGEDLGRLGHPPHPDLALGGVAAGRAHQLDAAGGQQLEVLDGGRRVPHARIHGRGCDDRAGEGKRGRRQHVGRLAVADPRKRGGRERSDAEELRMGGRVQVREHLRAAVDHDRPAGQRREGGRPDEPLRVGRLHDLHVMARTDEHAHELARLVRRDPPAHADQDHARSVAATVGGPQPFRGDRAGIEQRWRLRRRRSAAPFCLRRPIDNSTQRQLGSLAPVTRRDPPGTEDGHQAGPPAGAPGESQLTIRRSVNWNPHALVTSRAPPVTAPLPHSSHGCSNALQGTRDVGEAAGVRDLRGQDAGVDGLGAADPRRDGVAVRGACLAGVPGTEERARLRADAAAAMDCAWVPDRGAQPGAHGAAGGCGGAAARRYGRGRTRGQRCAGWRRRSSPRAARRLQTITRLRGLYSGGAAAPPSVRTMRRWHRERRWLDAEA